jgi:hypothetical protein
MALCNIGCYGRNGAYHSTLRCWGCPSSLLMAIIYDNNYVQNSVSARMGSRDPVHQHKFGNISECALKARRIRPSHNHPPPYTALLTIQHKLFLGLILSSFCTFQRFIIHYREQSLDPLLDFPSSGHDYGSAPGNRQSDSGGEYVKTHMFSLPIHSTLSGLAQ